MGFHDLMDDIYYPGATNVFTGGRGSGKTHFVVDQIEYLLSRGYYICTNILFKKLVGFDNDGNYVFEECYPGHVYKTTTFLDLMKTTANIIRKDKNAVICVFLDEAQNFFHAYRTMSNLVYDLLRYHGNARKFHHYTNLITPSFESIPRLIREKKQDILNAHWNKSERIFEDVMYYYLDAEKYDIKQIVILEFKDFEPEAFIVGVEKYNKKWSDMEIGDIVYDHMSTAVFRFGNYPDGTEFDFTNFLNYIGDVISDEVPHRILEYFELQNKIHQKKISKETAEHERLKAVQVGIWLRENTDMTFRDIEELTGVPIATLHRFLEAAQVS